MALNILYVSAAGTSKGLGGQNDPMDLKTAVQKGGSNSVIVLLNNAGPISTEGVALHKNQYLLGEGSAAEVYHSDGQTKEVFTAPGSGGAQLHGTSKYNAVVGTHPDTSGITVTGVSATGGVNNSGMIAETRYHFILSGQSNMAGWANASDFDKELQAVQDDVKIWTGGQFESLNPTGNSAPLDYGARPSASWAGSELSLGANLADALGTDVYFTKVTAGGTAIDRWINRDLNNLVLSHSLNASQALANEGYAPIMGGIAWNQGEYDMWYPSNYDQDLIEMLTQLQTAMGISDLQLIASGVSPQQGGQVIEDEILQAVENSQFIQYFSMLNFTESSNGYNHFSAEAYSYMGYQFAVRFLENLMGNPVAKDDVDGYIPPRLRPVAPEANDDTLNIVIGLSEGEGNLLANDSDYNMDEQFYISKINGSTVAVGQWMALAEGGRIKIEADGSYSFDPMDDFNDLKIGDSLSLILSYEIMDEAGLVDQAEMKISIYGSNGRNEGAYIEAERGRTQGTNGDDVIYGTKGNDYIYSLQGFDMIFDYEGNNTIYASTNGNSDETSQSIIFTGDGRDVIYATAGRDIIEAGNGNNYIQSYGGDDEITTGDGNDYINSRGRYWTDAEKAGNKIINSGNGNDQIYTGASDDFITAGDGNKTIYSSDGNDRILVGNGNNYINTARTSSNNEGLQTYIIGGSGNNRVYTSESHDMISLGHGNNNIYSYGGNDNITSGNGNDYINSRGRYWTDAEKAGDKIINSGDGNDRVYTGAGDDIIRAGEGANNIYSGGGNDKISVGDGNNYIDIGYAWWDGEDTISYITTGDGNNNIRTDAGNSHIYTGDGDNRIYTYAGDDSVFTGNGDDMIYLYGNNSNNDASSKNTVSSGAGNDRIYTSFGQDVIDAGEGDDVIYASRGQGHTFVFEEGDGNDTIYNFNHQEDKIQFNVEGLTFDDLQFMQRGWTYITYGDGEIALNMRLDLVSENMFLFT